MKIICHMMMSVDGRIDCAMTTKLTSSDIYYDLLSDFGYDATVTGKNTALLEMGASLREETDSVPVNKPTFYKGSKGNQYTIVCDTNGTLMFDSSTCDGLPLLLLVSEKAPQSYLSALENKGISYIAVGKEEIDLKKAAQLLEKEFFIHRLVIVGGGRINAGFLNADLIDELSILIGPGVDGRNGMTSVFDGLSETTDVHHLKVMDVKKMPDDSIWIQYEVINEK